MSSPGSASHGPVWQIRAALLKVLQCLDPAAAHNACEAGIQELLEIAQAYGRVPTEVIDLVGLFSAHSAEPKTTEATIFAPLEIWVAQVISTRKNPENGWIVPQDPASSPVEPPRPAAVMPVSWEDLVKEMQVQLHRCPPGPPFEMWQMPRLEWSSQWSEAHAVISRSEKLDEAATVLIPSESAENSPEASEWWRLRIRAANALRSRAPKVLRWPRVIDCGAVESPGYILLERPTRGTRSLLERTKGKVLLSGRQCVELGIELCRILKQLNDLGAHILDLSPEQIFFEWTEGCRMTQLADPTAVIPSPRLLPEWRAFDTPRPEMCEARPVEPSQVFVVGAIVLASLQGTIPLLNKARFPAGPYATLAALAGWPELSNGTAQRVLEPLVNVLEDRAGMEVVDARKLVESTLRWCLAEEINERFQSLSELSDALKSTIR